MLDFPNPPLTNGQLFSAPNGTIYQWETPPGVWNDVGTTSSDGGGGAPSGPAGGDLAGTYPNPQLKPSTTNGQVMTTVVGVSAWATPSGGISVEAFGAIGDGVHDDTAALQAAANYLNSRGGGRLFLGQGKYLIDSGNLNLGHNVILTGSWLWPGTGALPNQVDFSAFRCVLLINPLYSIVMNDIGAGIDGVAVFNKNVFNAPAPTTLRQNLDRNLLFAGKAITIGSGAVDGTGTDSCIQNSCFGGFDYAVYNNGAARLRMSQCFIDCNNGVYVTNCHDWEDIHNVECWPFISPGALVPFAAQYTVANVTNNGSGLIRITTVENTILTTGDQRVAVAAVNGVPNANGTWTVTVIDATHFDLQGSTFAGSFIANGAVNITAVTRSGVAFNFDGQVDFGQLTTCMSFGWHIAFRIWNSGAVTLTNCSADNYFGASDNSTTGFYVGGSITQGVALVGCIGASHGSNLTIDVTTGTGSENIVSVTDFRSYAAHVQSIHMINGNASFVNCAVENGGVIGIEATAGKASFIGGYYVGAVLSAAAGSIPPVLMEATGLPNQVTSLALLPTNQPNSGGLMEIQTGTAGTHNMWLDAFVNQWRVYSYRKSDNAVVGLWEMNLDGSGWAVHSPLYSGLIYSTAVQINPVAPLGLQVLGGDSTNVLFAGTTKGIRFGFDSFGAHIEGVDNTGLSSFQPLNLSGSVVNVGAPLIGSTATFSGTVSANGFTAGYLEIPQQAQTGNYTAVLADSGKHLYHAVAAAAATYTIPANSSVSYPIGTTLTMVNDSANAVTIAITTDTLVLSPGTTTGSRTLATGGVATALKVTSTRWVINGTGLT